MKNKNFIYHESYIIKYSYQKEDGFWSYGNSADIFVPINPGMKEKCNHHKARKLFIYQNKHLKNLQIQTVIYV